MSCPVVVYEEINADFLERKGPKNDKKTKNFPIVNVFMQFLSNFRKTSWIRMLKTLNMALVRCPVGFSEEIIAILQLKKISN